MVLRPVGNWGHLQGENIFSASIDCKALNKSVYSAAAFKNSETLHFCFKSLKKSLLNDIYRDALRKQPLSPLTNTN